jgi:predicted nuclease of predicted toxin-antitoxin system
MKILVDENIPAMTVRGLREYGHDVKDIRGTESEGQSDVDLWVSCGCPAKMSNVS